MNYRQWAFLGVALASLAVLFLILDRPSEITSADERADPAIESLAQGEGSPSETRRDAEPPNASDAAVRQADAADSCIPLEQLVNYPAIYESRRWFEALGDRTLDTDRTYFRYDFEQLEALAAAGDASAMFALGMHYRWQAQMDGERWPLDGYDFTNLTIPVPGKPLDVTKLEQGRKLLYEAALRGKPLGLIEIMWSYVDQQKAAEKAGASQEELDRYKATGAFYGELAESLLEGVPENFVQAAVPDSQREWFNQRLTEGRTEFLAQRIELGYRDTHWQVPDSFFEAKLLLERLCGVSVSAS